MELQALAQQRLKSTRAKFADGIKAAKEVKSDLAWTQKRVEYVLSFVVDGEFTNHYARRGT